MKLMQFKTVSMQDLTWPTLLAAMADAKNIGTRLNLLTRTNNQACFKSSRGRASLKGTRPSQRDSAYHGSS